MDAVIVGIDVAKDKLDVAVRPWGERFVVSRDEAGLEALRQRLRELQVALVGLEATGGYETVVAASLLAAGLLVVVVNPAQVRAFAKALGKRAQTDPIDAAVIADFIEATKPNVRPLPDEATRQLSDLVARRSQILAMIVAEQQRKKHHPNKRMLASIERLLAALQKELSDLDGQIREAIQASSLWRAMEGQELHRRRTRRRAQRPVHGGDGGRAAQSHAQGLLRAPARRRKRQDGRADPPGAKLLTILNAMLRDGEPWMEPQKPMLS
jgi:transposase